MRKQNVIVPEELALTRVMPASAAGGRDTAFLGGIAVNCKIVSQLEIGNGGAAGAGSARISPWVETLHASSPTHVQAAFSAARDEEHEKWVRQHPSALINFNDIVAASKGKRIVMFLDYDGTLSPIVDDPDRAFMSDDMREAVRDAAKHFPTAIVSGRCRDKVFNFVQLSELYYAGSHGMDIKGPSSKGTKRTKSKGKSVFFQPASEYLPMIEQVHKTLVEKTNSIPGSRIENNKFTLSVHFRCVDEKKWSSLNDQVRSVVENYPQLMLTAGRKVLEIRPTIKWDKGKALEFLLESLGFADCSNVFPVHIGDDNTDEDAFRVLHERGLGVGILVSKVAKKTKASFSLRDPTEVKEFLRRLVEWKRPSSKN